MKRTYVAVLVLKVPSESGEEFDFRTKSKDVNEAAEKFNRRFKGLKGIVIREIREREIELTLTIDDPTGKPINARELSSFSKKLYHESGWSLYSRETAKLFTAKVFEDITETSDMLPQNSTGSAPDQLSPMLMSDLQALEALDALIKIQDLGSPDIRAARKKQIEAIKTILIEILS